MHSRWCTTSPALGRQATLPQVLLLLLVLLPLAKLFRSRLICIICLPLHLLCQALQIPK